MRKSTILVLVIVLAAVAIFLAQRAMLTRPAPPPARDASPDHDAALTAAPDDGPSAELNPVATPSRTEAGRQAAADPRVPSVRLHKLRIHVAYSSGRDERPSSLEVRLSNHTGALYPTRRKGPNEFELVEALPGPYVVVASALNMRNGIARAVISADTDESETTVTLHPERVVRVRWRGVDGKPISAVLARASIASTFAPLVVYATRFPLTPEGPSPEQCALASLHTRFGLRTDEQGQRTTRDESIHSSSTKRPDLASTPDTLGFLTVDEDGPLWASAFCCGVLVAEQQFLPGDEEVVFTSTPEDLTIAETRVTLRVVDDVGEVPIAGAKLVVVGERASGSETSDASGNLEVTGIFAGDKHASVEVDGYHSPQLSFRLAPGQTLDLGKLRLHREGAQLAFDVKDERGAEATATGFELLQFEQHDGTRALRSLYSASVGRGRQNAPSGVQSQVPVGPNLVFRNAAPGRYLLRCTTNAVSCEPRVVEAYEFTRTVERSAPVIVIKPTVLVSFVLDHPISAGTLVMVESRQGLPVRELTVNEFGVVTTSLVRDDYRVHLVEHGRKTGWVAFKVDSDPYVFEIHR
ncbi:MAG: hypothetical protein JNL28_06635 [Planctomycetes bacterium]|nr:hypothetical protein [Planctomycetota bacterium]